VAEGLTLVHFDPQLEPSLSEATHPTYPGQTLSAGLCASRDSVRASMATTIAVPKHDDTDTDDAWTKRAAKGVVYAYLAGLQARR
jgi:hypothetical protein